MEKQEILNKIQQVTQERESLFELKKPIDEKLHKTHNQLDRLRNQLSNLELKETRTEEETLIYFLTENDDEGMAKYKARDKYLYDLGLGRSGYHREIQQANIQIGLTYNDSKKLEKVLTSLEKVLPHVKPLEDGYKHISIIEHNLSQYGSYYLLIKDGEYKIASSYRDISKYKTLRKALEYIQEQLWYDGRDNEDD